MDITFTLQSTTDGTLMTGQASNTTVYISKDGGAFAATTNAVAEIGRGLYKVELTDAESAFSTLVFNPVCAGAQNNLYAVDAPTDISGLATSSALADVATNVSAVKAKTDNLPAEPAAVGSAMTLTSATITSVKDGLATGSGLSSLASHGDTYWVTANVSGLATGGGLEALANYGDSHWSTAEGFATPSDVTAAAEAIVAALPSDYAKTTDVSSAQTALTALINSVLSGIFHWAVEGSILTIYNASNVAIGAYTLTKDSSGNITAVTPIVQPEPETNNAE